MPVGIYQHKSNQGFQKGHKHSPETLLKIKEAHLKNPVGYWKGKKRPPFSQEWKDNIGKSEKGKILSQETKEKMSKAKKGIPHLTIRGENHWKWKGGVSTQNRKLRTSYMWKLWREAVFLRDNFICQNKNCKYCMNRIGVFLHPHHIKPLASYPELAFEVSNGITYCKAYHLTSKTLHKGINKGGNN